MGHGQRGKVGTLNVNKTNFMWSGQGPWRLRLDDGTLVAIADPAWLELAPGTLKRDFAPLGPHTRGVEAVFWEQSKRGAAQLRRGPPKSQSPAPQSRLGAAIWGGLSQMLPRSMSMGQQPNRTLKKTEVLAPALQRQMQRQQKLQQCLELHPSRSAPSLVTALVKNQRQVY